MGMVLQLRRGSTSTLSRLQSPDDFRAFVAPDDAIDDGSLIDLDKSWHAIHFLLAGTAEETSDAPGALLGGRPVTDDFGYGPARLLDIAQVREFAKFLDGKPHDFIERTFDAGSLNRFDIYPGIWDDSDQDSATYVAEAFRSLKTFFAHAAANGEFVVLAIL